MDLSQNYSKECIQLNRTKQYHKIIHNPDDIRSFANTFNIDKKHLGLCLYLTMRRKYYPTLSQSIIIVNRIIIPGGLEFKRCLYQNILRLETPLGSYTDRDIVVPDEALALYVMIDPKDTIKAMSKVLSKCVDSLCCNSLQHELKSEDLPNAYSLYREEIPKSDSIGQKHKQIDLDTKDLEKVVEVHELLTRLKIAIVMCIETRGGFHIIYLANTDKDVNRSLYEFKQKTAFNKENIDGKMVTDYWFSITKQPTVIMPGTYQGGFPAHIVNLEDWIKEFKQIDYKTQIPKHH